MSSRKKKNATLSICAFDLETTFPLFLKGVSPMSTLKKNDTVALTPLQEGDLDSQNALAIALIILKENDLPTRFEVEDTARDVVWFMGTQDIVIDLDELVRAIDAKKPLPP